MLADQAKGTGTMPPAFRARLEQLRKAKEPSPAQQ
jgi:hypothetical protein